MILHKQAEKARRGKSVCSLGYGISAILWYHYTEGAYVSSGPLLLSLHLSLYKEGSLPLILPGRPVMRTTPIVESTKKRGSPRPLIAYCLERATLFFSMKMALIVGTLLAVINHGQAIFTGHFSSDRRFPRLLTYVGPVSEAMYRHIKVIWP